MAWLSLPRSVARLFESSVLTCTPSLGPADEYSNLQTTNRTKDYGNESEKNVGYIRRRLISANRGTTPGAWDWTRGTWEPFPLRRSLYERGCVGTDVLPLRGRGTGAVEGDGVGPGSFVRSNPVIPRFKRELSKGTIRFGLVRTRNPVRRTPIPATATRHNRFTTV